MERGLNLLVIFVLMQSIVVVRHFTIAQNLARSQQDWCLTNVDCQYQATPHLDCVKNFETRSPNKWG